MDVSAFVGLFVEHLDGRWSVEEDRDSTVLHVFLPNIVFRARHGLFIAHGADITGDAGDGPEFLGVR